MTIKITTQSGSIYELQQQGNKLFIRKGIRLTGEVVKVHEPIQVGGVLHLDFTKEGLFCKPHGDPSLLRTSPITEIVIL